MDDEKIVDLPDDDDGSKFSVLKVQALEEASMDYDEVFQGFEQLEVFTFSYDLQFIEEVASKYFEKMTIILGCEAIVNAEAMDYVLASQKKELEIVSGHKRLMEMVKEGRVEFRILHGWNSHAKVYIMSDFDDSYEHNRILFGSANFSGRGFAGPDVQIENLSMAEDDPIAYETYKSSFDALYADCADEVPEATLIKAKEGTLKDEDLPIYQTLCTKRAHIYLSRPEPGSFNEAAKLAIIESESKKYRKFCHTMPKGVKIKELQAEELTEVFNKKREEEKRAQPTEYAYPELKIDYDSGQVLFNNKPYDTDDPDMAKAKNDLILLDKYFDGYNDFLYAQGSALDAQQTYFKLLNYMFLSPFIAKLRYTSYLYDGSLERFPYYAMLRGDSNAGKTQFVDMAQQLMFGEKIPKLPCTVFKESDMATLSYKIKGIPICLDDMTGRKFARVDDIIKGNDEILCQAGIDDHGVFIITSNVAVKDPSQAIAKRMFVLSVQGQQDNVAATDKKSAVTALLKEMSTELYNAYLKEMLPIVQDMIAKIQSGDINNPDIFKASSLIIMDLYKQCRLDIPLYVSELSYEDYFGEETRCASSIEIIENAYKSNPDKFTVKEAENTLEYVAGEYESNAKDLKKIIPVDMHPRTSGTKVIMDLDGARKYFKINFQDPRDAIVNAWRKHPGKFSVKKSRDVLEYTVGSKKKATELIRLLPSGLNAALNEDTIIMGYGKAREYFNCDFKTNVVGRIFTK